LYGALTLLPQESQIGSFAWARIFLPEQATFAVIKSGSQEIEILSLQIVWHK